MFRGRKQASKFVLAAMIATVTLTAAGIGMSQTKNKATWRFRGTDANVTYMGGGRDYVFFKESDGVEIASKVLRNNREDVNDFFVDAVGVEKDGAAKAWTDFTKRFNVTKEEFTFANFMTRFWTPHRFLFFANYVERLIDENSNDFGFNIGASREDVNVFLYNYFSNKTNNWNPDSVYTAFLAAFPSAKETVTFAAFRDYVYVPGLLRTFAGKTIIGIKTNNPTVIDNMRE